ncbi:hypothetical protein ACLOJK_004286 [Asimina triloba]
MIATTSVRHRLPRRDQPQQRLHPAPPVADQSTVRPPICVGQQLVAPSAPSSISARADSSPSVVELIFTDGWRGHAHHTQQASPPSHHQHRVHTPAIT